MPSSSTLVRHLHRAGIAADDTSRRRAEYSSDASNYRVPPEVVVFPRDVDEVLTAQEIARDVGIPITARGGGTSVAGNSIGTGMVIDFSRNLDRVLDLDPIRRTARVEPGVVLANLQAAGAPHALRFGPDPSTQARCTLGGMIGNNACGPRALAYGRTADNVRELEVVDGRGRQFTAGRDLTVVPGLEPLVTDSLAAIRTELGQFGRQISGYSLEHLAPENGHDLAKALVGTEGTCVTVLAATVDLVPVEPDPVLVVLGYPDMAAAADAVPALQAHRPVAMEGLDRRIVEAVVRHRGAATVPELPAGDGWLFVEMGGDSPASTLDRAKRLVADAAAISTRILEPGPEARALWRIREDGAGLAGRTPSGRQAWPGIEDAAVPPQRLGSYLRAFERLLAEYRMEGMPYGHFGDGCVHVRVDMPLEDTRALREFMEEAADLVVAHGGSLSGEHGDGRARGELLGRMYSPAVLELFAGFKGLLDPNDQLNPGIVVRPRPLDADVRLPLAPPVPASDGFAFLHDDGDVTAATHRCVGVGKCRADTSSAGGFMCPSFLATRDEKDSTRGRARVLQETIAGGLIHTGWRSSQLEESLDLCLSCKACASDCPAGVDIATLKSESLHRRYRRRLRPITHYTLGWLPRWVRLATRLAGPINRFLSWRWATRAALLLGGMDKRRAIPRLAPEPFRRWWRRNRRVGPAGPQVMLWVDTFSDNFSADQAIAAVQLLEEAGYQVVVPDRPACCGLTWITTGQLNGARRQLRTLLDVLGPAAQAGLPIVGLEPSCTAVLRSDLLELLPDHPDSQTVARSTYTLAELLSASAPIGPRAWTPTDLSGTTVVVQPHCHHHAVMGFDADIELLRRCGAEIMSVAGCCGLAGNFGMERGHFDVSVAVAENGLIPALRSAPDDSVLLADGMSCRTQADQLAGVDGIHLAQLLTGRHKGAGQPA